MNFGAVPANAISGSKAPSGNGWWNKPSSLFEDMPPCYDTRTSQKEEFTLIA